MESYLKRLEDKELLTEQEIEKICHKALDILVLEGNICRISSPAMIVGDIHGQFEDLVKMFQKFGFPGLCNYVFLGDYVDRGDCSLECILYLLIYKILYPTKVTLLRGNHEHKSINKTYGFYEEIMNKYSNDSVWIKINRVFCYFNLACIVDGRYLCVHGGISPRYSINKLERQDRFGRVLSDSIIHDVTWSDPQENPGFRINPRGTGYLYGGDMVKRFLIINNLELIIRSHQLPIEGYKWYFDDLCLTIWSAPNYMRKCYNPGSICMIKPDEDVTRNSVMLYAKAKEVEKADNQN